MFTSIPRVSHVKHLVTDGKEKQTHVAYAFIIIALTCGLM